MQNVLLRYMHLTLILDFLVKLLNHTHRHTMAKPIRITAHKVEPNKIGRTKEVKSNQ